MNAVRAYDESEVADMTPQEREMLIALANRIAQTPPPHRDTEADEWIRDRIGSRPDALYILTQTVLIQNLALEQAQKQIRELEERGSPAQGQGSSFLGGPTLVQPPNPGQQSWPGYGSPAAPPSAPSGWFGSGGGSSFLRGAATTAAGVAAGALAFEGIRALFGGSEHLGFGTHDTGFLSGAVPVSETIINNYYESPRDAADDNAADSSEYDDSDQDDVDDSGPADDDSSDDFS
jgi:hypothetical protein